jgi:trimeric autotransporter adhesin
MRVVRYVAQICVARVASFHIAVSAAAACSLAATACGGGGGGTGPVPVASVEVALAKSSMLEGETTNATATTKDASGSVLSGRPISWASSDPTVATVTQAGMVTALKAGSTNVSASSEGRTGTATVTVTALPVASVSVSLGSSSIIIGATTQATSTVKDANGRVLTGRAVTWSSDVPSIATVNSIGFVSAVGAGIANITATSEGQSGSAPIMVTPPTIASITVTLASPILASGSRTQATATARDKDGNILAGKALTLSSDNTSIATVTAGGVVTGILWGTANITAAGEGVTGSAPITVAVSAGYGTSAEKIHIVDIGTTFTPTLSGPGASAATFISRATSVATVDGQGTITGVGEGQGWVAVTAPSFAPDSVYVIVPRNSTGPLLRSDLTNFNVQAGTTIVVNVILDTRSTPVGGAELSVGYTTNPLVFQSISILGTGSPSPLITSVQQGVFRVSLASGSPLSGQLAFLKFTFTAPISSGAELLSNRSGFLTLTLLDLVDPAGADLLPVSTSTRIPVIVK